MATPLRAYVNGVLQDGSQIVMPIGITHGRSKPDSQPDAPDCTITWKSITTAPVHGDLIELIVELPAGQLPPKYDDPEVMYDDPRVTYGGEWLAELPRFTGTVTDIDTQEVSGYPGRVRIVAVSGQANLGRINVKISRPVENDIARVNAIAAAAGFAIQIHGNPGPMLAPDEIDRDAQAAIQEVCQSSGGLFWTDTGGAFHYGTGDHRQLAQPMAAIPAHAILSGLRWQSTLADLINKAIMKWEGGAGGQHTVTDDVSISIHGIREKTISTGLNDQGAADQLGVLILSRRAWPYAKITDVLMDSDHISGDDSALGAALHLRVSDAVLLPIPPDPAPAGLLAEWIVEGYQEEWITGTRVAFQFAVTDRARFAQTRLRDWDHARANSWQSELDRGAWLDTLILESGET